ncbi:O-antigen ligase family protein [Lacibacter sp. MH-610]|uniref:O-antigen ligase family protein n=1 Tax=Lacibacter sp. MH-610 TaxID=3020883 RepID=UPI00389293D4
MINSNIIKTQNNTVTDLVTWLLAAGIAVTMVWFPFLNGALCVLFFLMRVYQTKFRFRINQPFLFFILTGAFVVSAISFFYSANVKEALNTLQLKLPLLVFPLAFADGSYGTAQKKNQLLYLFSGSVLLYCLVLIGKAILFYWKSGNVNDLFGYHILPLQYVYPSVAALFCVFGVAIHMHLINGKKNLLCHLIAVLVFLITLFLLSNRLGLISGILLIVYFVIRMFPGLKLQILTGSILLVLITGFILINQPLRNRFQTLFQFNKALMVPLDEDASLGKSWDGLYLRIAIWNCAADVIKSNPVTGVGVGDVQDELQKSYENRKFYFASRYNRYNAHNQFIEQWLMTGLIGLLFLMLAMAVPFYYSIRKGDVLYSLFLLVFILFCCTESMLEISKGVVWYSFFNSIFAFNQHKPINP